MINPIKYSFFTGCGAAWACDEITDDPAAWASEFAATYGLEPDEITWEQAEGTVDNFDKFFPPEVSQIERIAKIHVQELKEQIDTGHRILDTYNIGPGTLCERIGLLAGLMLHHQQWHQAYKEIARNGGKTK